MAAQGYIGRAPGDSSVIVARQTFTPTGITTNFTFASGYTVGYVDAYLNGARLIEGDDYTATDGSVVGLTTHAINGDVLELVVYKAFNIGDVTGALNDFSVSNDLTVGGAATVTGSITATGGVVGNVTGDATGLSGTPDLTIRNLTGVAATFTGVLSYDDVTNVDAVGYSTFREGINVQGAGSTTTTLNVSGVTTMTGDVNLGADFNIPDAITHAGDSNTKIRFPAADTFTVETAGSEAIRVSAAGSFGIGTNDPTTTLDVSASSPCVRIGSAINTDGSFLRVCENQFQGGYLKYDGSTNSIHIGSHATADADTGNDVNRITIIRDTGNVGIGTTSPSGALTINADGDATQLIIKRATTAQDNGFQLQSQIGSTVAFFNVEGSSSNRLQIGGSDEIAFFTSSAFGSPPTNERIRIDSSGRLLVGTSNARTMGTAIVPSLQAEGTSSNTSALALVQNSALATIGGSVTLAKTRATSNGGTTVVQSGENLGSIYFEGADGTNLVSAARIFAAVDGTPGSNDMPGRLVFSTTADGASSPTERLRINAAGRVSITNASGIFANLGEGLTIRADSNSTSDTSGLHIMNNSLTTDTNAGILFRNYDNHGAYIRSIRTGGVAGRLVFGTNNGGGISQSNITTKLSIESKSIKFQAFMEEQAETRSNDISNDGNFDVVNGNILYYEGSANGAAAQTINIRGNSSTTYNLISSIDFVASLTVIHQPNSSEYVNAISIDGTGQTVEWLGGSAPSSASSSAYEVIHITVIKLGNASYKVLASVNEYD